MSYDGNFSSIFSSGGFRSDYIVSGVAPSLRNNGKALVTGDLWWDTTTSFLYFWSSSNQWTKVSKSLRAAAVFNAIPSTIIPSYSFGIASITRSGHSLTINFAPGVFANGNYAMAGFIEDDNDVINVFSFYTNSLYPAKTASSTTFTCMFCTANSTMQQTNSFLPPRVEVAFFGGN